MTTRVSSAGAGQRQVRRLTIGEVLGQLRASSPTSRSPRSASWRPGADPAGAHAVRLPQVLRATTSRGCVRPGQQRDHYLPLRVIKDQLDAIDRGLEPPDGGPGAPRGRRRGAVSAMPCPAPTLRAGAARVRLSREELLERSRPGAGAAGRARAVRAGQPAGRRLLRRRRAGDRARCVAEMARYGSRRGTCGLSAPPPTARSACSPRSSDRWPGSADRRRGPAPRRRFESWRRCRCGCTPRWSRSDCGRARRLSPRHCAGRSRRGRRTARRRVAACTV